MAESPLDVVRRLRGKIERRRIAAKRWSRYYDGDHDLLFASPEFSSLSGGLFDDFSDNWCQVVADATNERLMPIGFRSAGGDLDKSAIEAWRRSECDVEFSLASLESLVTGRAFALVWRPGGETTDITFQGPHQSIVEYVPGTRRKRRYGMNVWGDGSNEFAALFSDTGKWMFERQGQGDWRPRRIGLAKGESPAGPNPMGVVPIVELPNRSRLNGRPRSEIENVAPLQNTVNTLWAHLMTASDNEAVPARAVLGMDRPTREILDDSGEVVGEEDLPISRFRRDRLLWLEGRDASIAEFSSADLGNYIKVIETAVNHIAAQTRTPPSYLTGQMVNVSADALTAAESGLVAKVTERQRILGAGLREIMRLEAIASGDTARAESLSLGSVQWRDAQFRSDAQYADALTKYKAIGVPDEALWEMIPGTEPSTIERWKTMRDSQAAAIVGGDIAGLFGPKPDPSGDPAAQ
ncbi:phage portal protein [Streptomyces avermitilis]|uniref:phage portal protein n=1 Tax=Streptomyces avermitilis TaxID=33903 RepID=UPI00381AA5B2